MHCSQLTLILVAALIAPAYSTSLATVTRKMWSIAGCSGTDNLVADRIDKIFVDGACTSVTKPDDSGESVTYYEKSSCIADTATNGYIVHEYTDSACSVGKDPDSVTEGSPTGSCVYKASSEKGYRQYGCSSTSATLGAVTWGQHSAAGCADSTLIRNGYWAINLCEMDMNQDSLGTWKKSYKRSIVNGNVVYSEWTDSASKDCSATVTPLGALDFDACSQSGSRWIKTGALIDGASVPGYSTLIRCSPRQARSNSRSLQKRAKPRRRYNSHQICYRFAIWPGLDCRLGSFVAGTRLRSRRRVVPYRVIPHLGGMGLSERLN